MGEDGLSVGELAPPKALRFSLGGEGMAEGILNKEVDSVPEVGSEPGQGQGQRLQGLRSATTGTSASVAAKIVAMVLPKERKNVIKPMGRCGGVFEHVNVAATTQVYENASASAASSSESFRSGSSSGDTPSHSHSHTLSLSHALAHALYNTRSRDLSLLPPNTLYYSYFK